MTKKMKIEKDWDEYSTTQLYEMLDYFKKMNNESKAKLVADYIEHNRNRGMLGYWLWGAQDGSPSIHNH